MPHKVNPIDFENCEGNFYYNLRKFRLRKFINGPFYDKIAYIKILKRFKWFNCNEKSWNSYRVYIFKEFIN